MLCVDRNDNTVCIPLHRQTARINHWAGKMYSASTERPKPALPTLMSQLYPCTLFIYLGLSPDQFRKHPTCWLQTILMWAANAFQVPACFNFLSCDVLDQYLSINCTFQLIQRNTGEKWCSTHVHTPFPFKLTNKYPINTSLGAKRFLCMSRNFSINYTLRAQLI